MNIVKKIIKVLLINVAIFLIIRVVAIVIMSFSFGILLVMSAMAGSREGYYWVINIGFWTCDIISILIFIVISYKLLKRYKNTEKDNFYKTVFYSFLGWLPIFILGSIFITIPLNNSDPKINFEVKLSDGTVEISSLEHDRSIYLPSLKDDKINLSGSISGKADSSYIFLENIHKDRYCNYEDDLLNDNIISVIKSFKTGNFNVNIEIKKGEKKRICIYTKNKSSWTDKALSIFPIMLTEKKDLISYDGFWVDNNTIVDANKNQ